MDVEIDQILSVCRICLLLKEDMKPVLNIADIIMTCASIQILEGDGLPDNVCPECIIQAKQAYDFRLLCEQSDNILRKRIIKDQIVLIKTDSFEREYHENSIDNSNSSPHSILNEKLNVPSHGEHMDASVVKDDVLKSSSYLNDSSKCIDKRVLRKDIISNSNPLKSSYAKDIGQIIRDESKSDSEESDYDSEGKAKETCRFCDKKFRYQSRLRMHEQKHIRGLRCHICEKDFLTMKQLSNHINIHSRKGAHLCQTCGKQFTLPENLVRHQRIHAGIRPYKCQLCSKSFTQSNELKSHLVTHTAEKHHLCSVCGNKYSRSVSLRVHMRRIHSIPPNHRPYICDVCGRNFKANKNQPLSLSSRKADIANVLKTLVDIHGQLGNHCQSINDMFHISLASAMLDCLLCGTASISFTITSLNNSGTEGRIMSLIWALYTIHLMVFIVYHFEAVTEQANKFVRFMNEIRFIDDSTEEIRDLVCVQLLRLRYQKVTFTVYKLFPINYNLIVSAIGFISTYTAILYQFRDMYK